MKLAQRTTSAVTMQEEQDFCKKVQWLEDHGGSDKDEIETSGEESESSTDTTTSPAQDGN